MNKRLILLLGLMLCLMSLTAYQSPVLPSLPLSEAILIGKWRLDKVNLYDKDNTLLETISPETSSEIKPSIIEILPNHKVKVIDSGLITEEGSSYLQLWSLDKNRLIIKSKRKEMFLKISYYTSRQLTLEMANPNPSNKQSKAILFLKKLD